MLKKIFFELVAIRKELQAIRSCLEASMESPVERISGQIQASLEKAARAEGSENNGIKYG